MGQNYNHTTLVGRLTKDPEVKTVGNDILRCRLTLAINRGYKKENGEQETDFIPVCLWGKRAELSRRFLTKGMAILVWGSIQVSYYDKNNERHWHTEIMAENFLLLGQTIWRSPAIIRCVNAVPSPCAAVDAFFNVTAATTASNPCERILSYSVEDSGVNQLPFSLL